MKLIDKDALVAEIESKIEKYTKRGEESDAKRDGYGMYWGGVLSCLNEIRTLCDTLEVKEIGVDLDKEMNEALTHLTDKDMRGWFRYFFELGLKARIDKELVEEVYSHIDGIKDTADRMTSGNFMHNRAAIKFSANTIAKVLELMGLKAQKGE